MEHPDLALTFDDVLLVPDRSDVLPYEVDLTSVFSRNISLNIPLISAAMDTVTEGRLAIALAQEGGLGIIHKNLSTEEQAAQVRKVKKFESGVVKDPFTIPSTTTICELLALTEQHNISGMPVVDGDSLVGIVTNRDVRFEKDQNRTVAEVMTPKEKLVTVPEGTDKQTVQDLLQAHRIEKILVVNSEGKLAGLMTVQDIDKARTYPNAAKDDQGRLRVGAAVGTGAGTEERVDALVKAGVDVIVVDTAHGHTSNPGGTGVIDRVRWVKQNYPDVQVIGGNIATADAAIALAEAGADGVKVGIGPGSICTTRIVAGVGVPQISAVANVAEVMAKYDVPVIADGGIRFSGDIAKAIAIGIHAAVFCAIAIAIDAITTILIVRKLLILAITRDKGRWSDLVSFAMTPIAFVANIFTGMTNTDVQSPLWSRITLFVEIFVYFAITVIVPIVADFFYRFANGLITIWITHKTKSPTMTSTFGYTRLNTLLFARPIYNTFQTNTRFVTGTTN